jgi:4-carboxymuconolactone decarboxylase
LSTRHDPGASGPGESGPDASEPGGSDPDASDFRASDLDASMRRLCARDGLDVRTRLLAMTGAATARGGERALRRFFASALALGTTAPELGEIALQTYLFAGYPRAINALFALRAVTRGYEPLRDAAPAGGNPSRRNHERRGVTLCRRIYRSDYSALRRNIAALNPDLDRWMVVEGYGRVLGRPGLDPLSREFAALSALVVLDVPRQIRSHLRGALNLAATVEAVGEVLLGTKPFAEPEAYRRARTLWEAASGPRPSP